MQTPATGDKRRVLITAGPTHEPIDAVRFLGNRSSGTLGVALALAAAERGHSVTLLLGPTAMGLTDTRVRLRRFRTAADLEALLKEEAPACDLLIMAAAVADYRPVTPPGLDPATGKLRREDKRLTIELEPTADLLAGCAARRKPGQQIVGFALEPRERMLASARAKLERKKVDAIVANPLETMDAPTIEATLVRADGADERTDGPIDKARFADWLLDRLLGKDTPR